MSTSLSEDGDLIIKHYRNHVRDAAQRGSQPPSGFVATVTIPLSLYEDLMLVKEWASCEFNRQACERWKAEEAARKAKEGESE